MSICISILVLISLLLCKNLIVNQSPMRTISLISFRYISNDMVNSFINSKIKLEFPPIDVVYTWVNGSDPYWSKQRNFYREVVTGSNKNYRSSAAVSDSRYRSNDELK